MHGSSGQRATSNGDAVQLVPTRVTVAGAPSRLDPVSIATRFGEFARALAWQQPKRLHYPSACGCGSSLGTDHDCARVAAVITP